MRTASVDVDALQNAPSPINESNEATFDGTSVRTSDAVLDRVENSANSWEQGSIERSVTIDKMLEGLEIVIIQQLEDNSSSIDEKLDRDGLQQLLNSAAGQMNFEVDQDAMDLAIETLFEEGKVADMSTENISRRRLRNICLRNLHSHSQSDPDIPTPRETESAHSRKTAKSATDALSNDDDSSGGNRVDEMIEDEQVHNVSRAFLMKQRKSIFWLSIYFLLSTGFVAQTSLMTIMDEASVRVFSMWVVFARGTGRLCNVNAALVLTPVSRRFLTWLQSRRRLRKFISFDAAHLAHKLFGAVFCLAGLAHTVFHCFTYMSFARADPEDLEDFFGEKVARTIPSTFRGRLVFLLMHRASITGFGMLFCMFAGVAVLGSRRTNFNKFWYFHHLLVVMLFLLCVHGTGALIAPSMAIMWVGLPLLVYLLPRIYREMCTGYSNVIRAETAGKVLAITVEKPKAWERTQKAGMYAMINVPAISRLEWHPVTISSAPHQSHVTFHINCSGDWTRRVKYVIMGSNKDSDGQKVNFPVRLEGPFGAPSQGTRDYDIVVLIGAGIGVTPMVSTLRSLLHKPSRLRKVFFYWTVRDSSSFRLFNRLMDSLYEQDADNRLEIRHFLTSAKTDSEDLGSMAFQHAVKQVHAKTNVDIRLGHKTKHQLGIGRPNWNKELQNIVEETKGIGLNKSGVFFCGPERMGLELQTICSSLSERTDCSLHFKKEIF